jgi:transposase-like protein
MTRQPETIATTRKPYPEEFKKEAVELLRTSGRSSAQVARELGVSAASLRLWRKQAENDADEREEPRPLRQENGTVNRRRIWVAVAVAALAAAAAVVFLLVPLAGWGGDDDRDAGKAGPAAKPEQAVDGSFVGEVSGTEAFVAVVAEPAGDKQQSRREVQIYLADGRRLSEWFVGSISDNSFVAKSDDGDAEAKGKLSPDSVAGTVELPDGKTARFTASRPAGAAGLYDLSISRRGKLTGASAGGLGLTGRIRLAEGTGTLKLADGRRLKLDVAEGSVDALARLQAGQVRLIVLPGGELAGVGKSPPAADSGDSDFFIRSS